MGSSAHVAVRSGQMNLKTPGRDRGTQLVMAPLEFIQRLAEQVLIRRGLPLRPARDTRASDWFLPTNSD